MRTDRVYLALDSIEIVISYTCTRLVLRRSDLKNIMILYSLLHIIRSKLYLHENNSLLRKQ